jgi:hypothetical protein
MTLRVAAFVNGQMIGELRIRNQGHPETGGHPSDDDLRRYRVELMQPGEPVVEVATVDHRRADGWQVLTIQALASLDLARYRQ